MDTPSAWVAGKAERPNSDLEVRHKATGQVFAKVPLVDADGMERAIRAAVAARPAMAQLASFERREILEKAHADLKAREEELAQLLVKEAGKPISDSRGEVGRLLETFRIAAGEAERMTGEVLPLDTNARAAGRRGFWKRVPIGVCSFIAPFNFPLNLAAHKIAPAIAAGCPFLLKPSPRTPVSAMVLGEVLSEAGLPDGAFSIFACEDEIAESLVTDPRIQLLSFTGSPKVGYALKGKAGEKKVHLELGGNAPCIVDDDADLEDAVERLAFGAFYQSGQSCIGVQRIYVQETVYEEVRERLVALTGTLVVGDPSDEDTFIGPMIDEEEARRLESWIEDAKKAGGRVLCGGRREGATLHPTLLENVPEDAKLCREEAFGPVAVLSPYHHFEEAIERANSGSFGLQCGVFTRDLYKAMRAWDLLEVGGVIVGDVPSWRADLMPYGGVKSSGLGREGPRFAIQEMTEIRLLAIREPEP